MNPIKTDKDFKMFSRWSIRRITFIGMLIAISVSFFLVVVQLMPFLSLPSYKISIIGLPIKIAGFIFGPVVGGFVGLVSELISYALVPTYFDKFFILAAVLDGVIPGIISWLFFRLIRFCYGGKFTDGVYAEKIYKLFKKLSKLRLNPIENAKTIEKIEDKIILLNNYRFGSKLHKTSKRNLLNINMIVCLLIISFIIVAVVSYIGFHVDEAVIQRGVIPNRWLLLGIMLSGYVLMMLFIIAARFKLRRQLYLVIVPIVVFSAVLETFNVPILALAEQNSLENGKHVGSIFVYMFQHIVTSPVKIWGNMFIIFFTYQIISPLIYKNHDITY